MKILVERLDVHGDVLVGTSVLPGLKQKYPGSEIVWHVRSGFEHMLMYNPYINHKIIHPFQPVNSENYDLHFSLDHHYRWNTTMVGIYCDICKVPINRPEIYLSEQEVAGRELELEGRILVANRAGWRSRECPNLSEAIADLATSYPEFLQVDLGPPIPGVQQYKLGLRKVAALMETAKLYVGIDTVFMHMAVACKVPMALCLGPTGPETQYIPSSVFMRPFVHLNPAEPHLAFKDGIQLDKEDIKNMIRFAIHSREIVNEDVWEYPNGIPFS